MEKQTNNQLNIAAIFILGAVFALLLAGTGAFVYSRLSAGHQDNPQLPTLNAAAPIASKNLAGPPQNTADNPSTSFAGSSRTVPIVAVRSSDGQGEMGNLTVRLIPGNGDVLVKTTPFIEPDVQLSANTAVQVAEQESGKALEGHDIAIAYESNSTLVGGGSAGAATTIAVLAELENRTIRPEVAMTGTIEQDGSIGEVGGVFEKAQAAAQAGYKLFLVPKGQSISQYYERTLVKTQTGYGYYVYRYRYVPKTIDIAAEADQQWGMKVVEVSDIKEAETYMLSA